jgi:hypothetical protein
MPLLRFGIRLTIMLRMREAMPKVRSMKALVRGKAKWQVTDIAPLKLSDVIWNGLLYSQEDVDSSSNYVLIYEHDETEDESTTSLDLKYPCTS